MTKRRDKVLEPGSFKAFFAVRFAQFLRDNYRRPEEVAVAFGVHYNTACNWLEGNHRAHGDVVAMAYELHPEEMHLAMRASVE